jgi:hypothetical protein
MSLGKQLLELLTAFLPLIVTLAPLVVFPRTLAAWVVAVIVTATTSLLSTGLLMMRATASCFVVQPQCETGSALISHNPGLFDGYQDCSICIPTDSMGSTFSAARFLNEHMLEISIGSWAACSLLSIFLIGRFILWSKRQRSATGA